MSELYNKSIECIRLNLRPFTDLALKSIEKHYKCTRYTIVDFLINTNFNEKTAFLIQIVINTGKSRDEDIKTIHVGSSPWTKTPIMAYDYRRNLDEPLTTELNNNISREVVDIEHIFSELTTIINPFWSKRFKEPPTLIRSHYRRIIASRKINTDKYPDIKNYFSNANIYCNYGDEYYGSNSWDVKLEGTHKQYGTCEWRLNMEDEWEQPSYGVISEDTYWGKGDPEPDKTKKICKMLAKIVGWNNKLQLCSVEYPI